jgi:hypothetical protein
VAYAEACRVCDEHLPAFLRNRPSDLVQHVRERMLATETIDENGVFVLGSSTFSVVAPFTVIAYRVEFGESTSTAAGADAELQLRRMEPTLLAMPTFLRRFPARRSRLERAGRVLPGLSVLRE